MTRITDYKLLQADGAKELQAEVVRFVAKGWEPSGRPFVGTREQVIEPGVDVIVTIGHMIYIYCQAIVKREPEHAELKRLRDVERHVDYIVTELDNPIADELGMVTFAHEELTKVLRGGRYER